MKYENLLASPAAQKYLRTQESIMNMMEAVCNGLNKSGMTTKELSDRSGVFHYKIENFLQGKDSLSLIEAAQILTVFDLVLAAMPVEAPKGSGAACG